jgi:glycosyltransferase involved in cell wall biosynthesis
MGSTLSVGIPAFNQGEYLEQTLHSLLNQTHAPCEIVVSDHHSTDQTPQIIDAFVQKHPGLIRGVKPPAGVNLAAQYSFTLSSLTGDWIALLSSDDIARPNYVETLLRGAARSPDAVLVRAGWENIDATGATVSTNYLLSVPRIEPPPANLLAQRHGPKAGFAAFAIRREAWLRAGPILESLESLADWALFLQLAPSGSFVYEHALIAGYRVGHDGNKFRSRLGPWCRDQRRIFTEVMPLAADRAGIRDIRFIAEASRYNCLRYLATASEEFTPAERGSILEYFRDWTRETGCQAALDDFAQGKKIATPMSLYRRLRRRLHPLAHSVASASGRFFPRS